MKKNPLLVTFIACLLQVTLAYSQSNNLQQLIDSCCNSHQGNGERKAQNTNLANQEEIVLNQNEPNPFAEKTTINFSIPESVNQAQLMFYDNTGRILKKVTINERGEGQLVVYAEKLSAGIYTYTLLCDGKVIETKKMVCEK